MNTNKKIYLSFCAIFALIATVSLMYHQLPDNTPVTITEGANIETSIIETTTISTTTSTTTMITTIVTALGKININTAGVDELTTLKGIGEKKAQKIIEYRNTHGSFSDITEIMEINGIGEKTFESLKDYICI